MSSTSIGRTTSSSKPLILFPPRHTAASICEDDLIAEVQALRTLGRHPNISKFYGLYENEKYYMMVLEYLRGGELIDVMIRRVDEGKANYTEAELAIIILQIARAVLHCHKYRVIHRDIKPENILCSDHKSVSDASRVIDAPVKLADFGLSAIIPEDEEGLTISSGTPNYMAPERLCGKVYSFKSDIWSIGVVLYILIEGKFPFPGDDEDEITKHVLDPTFPKYEGPHFDPISESCKDFLTQCFTKDPKFRPTASQLLSHEWLSGNTTATCTIKGAVEGLRRFNVRLKFRAMICAIVARNRLSNILRALRSEQLLLRLIEYGITLEEIKELAHSFRMAAWGHVMLDKETFIETMMDYSEIPDIELATEIYNAFHNAEGLVNTRDFLLALALRIGSSGSDRLGTVFWLFDKGDKGAIDFPSYYDMIVAIVGDSLNPVQTDALEEEFREADVDGNGLIDQNEFEQLAQRNECVHSYFDRLRRLMAGRREVFLSDLDEIRARKRGWLFMRYGGLFQRWVERYLVVTDDFKLELYTKDPGEGKAVRPEIVYSLDKAVLRTLDWSIATGTSTPNLSSRAPQGLGTRKTTPPRCRLECQEGSFLL
ncbi:CAMK/CDPK protein kinase, partial [Sphaeroforma arctica JP610]